MKTMLRIILLAIFVWSAVSLPVATGHVHSTGGGLPVDEQTDALVENKWYWKLYQPSDQPEVKIDSPSKYVLEFRPDGTVNITADCNRIIAGYTIKSSGVTITPGPATLALCPPGSKGEQFVKLLGEADQLFISGSTVVIGLKDSGKLVFTGPTLVDRCEAKALEIKTISSSLDPITSEKLDNLLRTFVEVGSLPSPGASLLVITPMGRYFKSVGVADVSTCVSLRADSRFQIGSNTKMMTAAMIYQLQESGRLSVGDRLDKWLPDLASRLPNGASITLEMLLTHTSGLPDYFEVEADGGKMSAGTKNKAMLTRGFTPLELVNRVAAFGQPLFKPGEDGKWSYSNTGYALLGLIIEKATGRSYEDNLRARIFKPLGLQQAFLQRGGPVTGSLPQAYFQWPFTYTTSEWNASQGWAAGAVVMTPDEFAVFLKALFTGRLFKKKQTLGMMLSIPPAGNGALGKGMNYGHGILENRGVLGHGGQTLGFQSDGGYIPGKDVTIVMWANSANNLVNRMTVPVIAGAVTGEQPR